jgi:predicted DNA-binding transcriptional regulator YafY
MPEEEISRLSRLMAIVTLLQSKKLITATFIADKFNISIRTVYRDIRALEQAGIPILTEEGRGYSLMDGYRIPPVMFTEEEANALVTAEQIIAKNKDESLVKNYTEAVTKIRSVMKYPMKERSELLGKRVVFRQNTEESRSSRVLTVIQVALTHYRVVQVRYRSVETGETTNRTIEPFAVYNTKENWILIAWCRLRKEFRSFRLDAIEQYTVTDEHFTPHKITLPEYFILCREKSLRQPLT